MTLQSKSDPPRGLQRLKTWTLRIGANELLMLVALLVVVLGTWGFIEIADEVLEGTTHDLDQAALVALREPGDLQNPIGPRWLEQSAVDISALGGPTVLLGMTVALLGFLLLEKRYNAIFLVLAATAGGLLLAWGLKEVFARPRPDLVSHMVQAQLSSFPSGHSMLSAIVYPTLGTLLARVVTRKRLKLYFLLVGLMISFLVGVSRVYVGVHYPTDVLAGWSVGLAWAAFCWTIAKWLQRRGALEGGEQEPDVPAAD